MASETVVGLGNEETAVCTDVEEARELVLVEKLNVVRLVVAVLAVVVDEDRTK